MPKKIEDKRTKIVCTIGPASESVGVITALIRRGMDVARLNFSHGTHQNHAMLIKNIRAAARKAGRMVGILADLQGPKVRVGILPKEGVKLVRGKPALFRAGTEKYKDGQIPVPYSGLAADLKVRDSILLDDGLLEVRVVSIKGQLVRTKVVTGGMLVSHKGFNVPTATLRIPAFTEKDREDLRFALRHGVDFAALSFVKSAADLLPARKMLAGEGSGVKLIVKIEKHEAVGDFDEILAAADGIMVARGDLGIEIPAEEVPIVQKRIIEKCLAAAKPVVVATQMLDSMIRNPRPTRAEVSDVANAVIDHADAVMLSGETATGKYPKEAVAVMARVIRETEKSHYDDLTQQELARHAADTSEAMGEAVGVLSRTPHIDAVIVTTASGRSAREIARMRPELPAIACTPDSAVARQLAISWGIHPIVIGQARTMEELTKKAKIAALRSGLARRGMRVMLVVGSPKGRPSVIMRADIIKL